ncbi:MAG: hypothetical protein WCH98_15230 [Verrucomicrobiota bacterium]
MIHNPSSSHSSRPSLVAAFLISALLAGSAGALHAVSKPVVRTVAAGAWKLPDEAFCFPRIGPPPAPGSAAGRRDIDRGLAMQARATPKESVDFIATPR